TLDRKGIDDFYGDWLLSPSVKLGDLPFFTGIMASETLADKLMSKADDPSINMWQQTVAEYVKESLDTAPVSGDTVTINNEWSLVIKQVDDKGAVRTIGLK
ncbi:potassium/proton antiporter, partial [Psychrobacter sp. FBL11]